jgi:hypothetical protein
MNKKGDLVTLVLIAFAVCIAGVAVLSYTKLGGYLLSVKGSTPSA